MGVWRAGGRGGGRTPNKRQHRKLTLKKISSAAPAGIRTGKLSITSRPRSLLTELTLQGHLHVVDTLRFGQRSTVCSRQCYSFAKSFERVWHRRMDKSIIQTTCRTIVDLLMQIVLIRRKLTHACGCLFEGRVGAKEPGGKAMNLPAHA